MRQFAFTQLQVFHIFTSILKGKWVLRAHLPQNQPAAEGRAAGPGFPKQLPKGMLLLSPRDSALELSWAEEEDGATSQGPPHSSWNMGEAQQYFLSAKGLRKPSLRLPCDQRQKSRNSLKPTVCFSA